MSREIADLAAELETLRLADIEARRQYAVAQRKIRDLAEFSDGLIISIAQRRTRADEVLDEWLAMQEAHAVAETLVDSRSKENA